MHGPQYIARPILWACALGVFLIGAAAPNDQRPVQIEMKNVRLHAADGIVLDIRALRGEMISRQAQRVPVFDDPSSYVLHVFDGQVSMDMASLTRLMNDRLFAAKDSPLRNITMSVEEGRLAQKATLHKGVPIPISMKGTPSVTPDGRLKIHADKVSAIGVPAKSLLDLFGLKLDDVVNVKKLTGIEIDGNDVILSPGQIVPPPEIRGRLTSVQIVGDRLIQTFGSDAGVVKALPAPPDPSSRNYIFFSGQVIRFGRLTMNPARLQLIDSDPRDAFDFFPARYQAQLVAGYSKNTPDGGLKTFMPDFDDLKRTAETKPRPAIR